MSGVTEVRVLVVGSDQLTSSVTDRLADIDDLAVETASELGGEALEEGVECILLPVESTSIYDLFRLERIRANYPHLPVVVAVDDADVPVSVPGGFPMEVIRLDSAPSEIATKIRASALADDSDTGGYDEQFRALVEHSPAMIAVLDAAGRYRYVSPSVERVLGHCPDELVGRVAFDQIHDDDRNRVVEKFLAAIENPNSRPSAEYRYRHADGEWRVLQSWGKNRLDDPDVGGFVVTTLDVTERKEYEQELERHQTMVETVADGVYALDEDLRVTTVNEAVLELTGYSRKEAIGSHITRFVDETDRSKVDQMRTGPVDSDQTGSTIELSIRRKDGSSFPAEVRFSLFDPDADEYTGSAGVIRDITDRKERERKLKRQNERLERFASVVSHDLRNPLNVIQGHLYLAKNHGDLDVEAVSDAAERMGRIIDELLMLAQRGHTVGETEPVNLAVLSRKAWTTVETSDAELTIDGSPRLVDADPDRLQGLLENLFRNAVVHGSSAVTVRVGPLADGFYVADDGPGIPPDEREAVFEWGHSTRQEGTGFGLAIVRSIVEAHGWTVEVTESEAGGARFEVTGIDATTP